MMEWPNDFYQTLVEQNVDTILVLDVAGQVCFANRPAAELFGRPISQIINLPFGFPITGTEPQELEIVRTDRLPRIVEMRVKEIPFQAKTYRIACLRDISTLALQREELRKLSFTDNLTGLYNRSGFYSLASNQLKLIQRTGHSFVLISLDLDGLKQINDNYGHSNGDKALVATAELLRRVFRETDIKARLSGDEFTVMLINSNEKNTEILINRLKKEILAENQSGKYPFILSLSFGISHFTSQQPMALEKYLEQVDIELYKHKASKKRLGYV